MTLRITQLLLIILCLSIPYVTAQEPKKEETKKDESKKDDGEWIQLFNGKNLDGWTPKIRYHELGENWNDTFRVEDGLLKVSYDKYDKFNETFGHLYYNEPFSHYILR